MPSDFDRLLSAAHAPRVDAPGLDGRGESEAVAGWAARYESAERPGGFAGLATLGLGPGLAVAFAALCLVIVGACVLPTSYGIPLGLAVEITSEVELPHAAIAEFVRERGDAGEVEVFVRRYEADGTRPHTQMLIRLWDQGLGVGELEHELREAFPEELDDATIIETALEGEVETIWGRRIAHRAFHVALREADVEQARAHLLMRLRAQGVTAEQLVVEIHDRDGRREIKVQIERELADGEAPELSLPLDELGPDARWVLDPQARPE